MKTIRIIATICLATLLIVGFPQDSFAINIAPARVDNLYLLPGDTGEVIMLIENDEAIPRIYQFEVYNFVSRDDEGRAMFLEGEGENEFGLSSWFQFPSKTISIAPGESEVVTVKIKAPNDAEAGGHYAGVFLSTVSVEGDGVASSVSQSYRVGMLILLTVDGEFSDRGVIDSFGTLDGGKLYNSLPVEFVTRVRNTGTVHFKPAGLITIYNTFGLVATQIDANQIDGNVLPDSVRNIRSVWDSADASLSDDGQQVTPESFIEKLKYEKEHFALGRYTASVNIKVGTEGKVESAEYTFWVIPWRTMLVGGIGLLLLIGLIYVYNRALVRRYRKNQGMISGKEKKK